ncbi:alpha/beta fold hydrolase [Flavobacterium sp. DSR3-2]|uniref:alpha/beta fold hydrolase n=1 Tax=Flavobacterium sp. DSR3-2 TaxID=2804634 RepID=UPI003CEE28FB
MAYVKVLPPNPDGRVILPFYNKNFSGVYWEQITKVLIKEGFHVLAPDQIGFGKSTKFMNYQFSFQQMSLIIKSILDSLNINKIILLLHSMC